MQFLQDHNYLEARFGVCLLGLLTLSLLAGCGGGGGGSNGNPTTGAPTTGTTSGTASTGSSTAGTSTGTNTGGTTSQTISAVTATGLTATLTEASRTVSVNGTLVYTLTLTNTTAAAIPVHATSTPSKPSAIVTVTGPTGLVSFQQLPGEPPLANGSLAAGQSISTTQTANGFTSAGTYSAVATFGDDTTVSKSVGPLTVTAQ